MRTNCAGLWSLAVVIVVVVLATSCSAKNVTISVNTHHLYDTAGHIINAHDGSLIWVNGTFYIFGTVYQLCKQNQAYCNTVCGYVNNTFAAYSSPDMSNGSWTQLSTNVLPAMSKDNEHVPYWGANVNYNNVTKKWVMTYWSGLYGYISNKIAVATSDLPQGPFVNQEPLSVSGPTGQKPLIGSTVGLFMDHDTGAAYLRYNTYPLNEMHVIEQLDATWTRTTGRASMVFDKTTFPEYEEGGMFKRNGLFYVTIGMDCCYCQWGADTRVFVAKDPLGKWVPQQSKHRPPVTTPAPTTAAPTPQPANWSNEINFCANGLEPPRTDPGVATNPCSFTNVKGTNFTVPAQQFFTATLPTGRPGEYTYMYYGEHFYSSPDGLKGHDLQAWIPFEFDGDVILPMRWLDTFTVEVP